MGTSTYTETLIIEGNCDLISNTGIIAYPNPTTVRDVSIEMYSEIDGEAELFIIDVSGRVLKEMTFKLHAGITIKGIDMSEFQYGIYMFAISMNGSESLIKVIKAD